MEFTEAYKQTGPCCFSPNSRYVAVANDYRLVIRDTFSFQVVQLFSCLDKISYIEWALDSEYILCGLYKKPMIQAWSISTGGFFGSSGAASNLGNGCFGFPIESPTLISPQFQQLVHYHHQQQQQELLSCFGSVNEYLNSHANEYGDNDRVKKSRGLVEDNGLLQDVVPSHMLKEE